MRKLYPFRSECVHYGTSLVISLAFLNNGCQFSGKVASSRAKPGFCDVIKA